MIKINDEKHLEYETSVSYDKFLISSKNKKIEGISPYITFDIDGELCVAIETVCLKSIIENLDINTTLDISNYISTIFYKDINYWNIITDSNLFCKVTRINNSDYKLVLKTNESIDIEIDTIVKF